jgi:probable H4MPT-linked C1 transfer pathway protein
VVNVLGWDIGGANTKATYLSTQNGVVQDFRVVSEYFPFWKRSNKQFYDMLSVIRESLIGSAMLDGVGVTLTAELSDVFHTKREGVTQIIDCVKQVFTNVPIWILNVNADLLSIEDAKAEPLRVSSANWAATGWMVAQYIQNCVIVDVGSTSTSVIPVLNGRIVAIGKTDMDKLIAGELVYTGSLRTNLAAIVQEIPVKGEFAKVSSELFAQSGDVHLILGHIKEADYTSETADGKGKTYTASIARLARLICADTEMLSEKEILDISRYIYAKQVQQIADALNQVFDRLEMGVKEKIPVVITGIGKDFLARKGAEKAGITYILDLAELLPPKVTMISPAVGVALMTATKLEGKSLKWMQ